jgi:hypothetical protein
MAKLSKLGTLKDQMAALDGWSITLAELTSLSQRRGRDNNRFQVLNKNLWFTASFMTAALSSRLKYFIIRNNRAITICNMSYI